MRGTEPPFLPFKKALLCARSLKLKTHKEWGVWCKSGARPANIPSNPDQVCLHARGVARVQALVGHGQCWCQKRSAVSAVQEGAAVRTLAQAERRKRMASVVQEWCTACQHTLQSRPSLRARGVARVRALAGHRDWCIMEPEGPVVQEGVAAPTFPRTYRQEQWQECCSACQRSFPVVLAGTIIINLIT